MKKIYHFDAFQNEKHFQKQPQSHSQTDPKWPFISVIASAFKVNHEKQMFCNE